MKSCCSIILLLLSFSCFSQTQKIDSLPEEGVLLYSGWKFQAGDNAEWAKSDYDDKNWQSVILSNYNTYLTQLKIKNIGWFRLHLTIDSSVLKKQLALQITQLGASEIYLNGKLFQQFGSIEAPLNYKSFNPVNRPFLLPLNISNTTVIAIRYATNVPSRIWLFTAKNRRPLTVTINSWNNALSAYETNSEYAINQTKLSYLFIALAFLFILLYLFFPKEKVNLLFGALCFFAVTRSYIAYLLSQGNLDISRFAAVSFLLDLNDLLEGILVLSIICQAVLHRITFYYKVLFLGMCLDAFALLIFHPSQPESIFNFTLHCLVTVSFFYLCVLAFRGKKYIIGIVALNSGLLNLSFFIISFHIFDTLTIDDYVRYAMTANFIMITIYAAINFARKSKNLEIQLAEVDKLSKENIKKEQEKRELLASQNETLEQQVTQRTSELKQSLENLQSTQAQLIQSEKMASLGELTAGIAHEIQNPLNFVNNFSEVSNEMIDEMKEELATGNLELATEIANDIKQNLEKINHHGKRADAIVKGMLQHSRQSKGIKEPTDINALCDEYLRLAYHGLRAKDKSFNTDFKTDFDESIGKINVVPQDIGRVLLNLFNNAFYAVNEKKKSYELSAMSYEPLVSIQTKKLNDTIEIRVEDNGNGIPQNIVDKIFQPFFTTKPTGQGTGLGLSLSYDIIKAHGGEIKVETKEGEGSEFMINLPV